MATMNDDNNGPPAAGSQQNKLLYSYCKSESLSEEGLEGLREMIEWNELMTPNSDARGGNYAFFFCACRNEGVTEGIIRCLLEYFPDAVRATDQDGRSPLPWACANKNATLSIIRLLIDAAPDSVRRTDFIGAMPLHFLCGNQKVDEAAAIQILKLLIEKHPEAVSHADNEGGLPIHYASEKRSPDFCRLLIESYPGSELITDATSRLPLHLACLNGSLATVEYLYKLYPDAIGHTGTGGSYPIHVAIGGIQQRQNPATAVEIVQFLLDCDPRVKIQSLQGWSLLRYACVVQHNVSSIEAGVQMIKAIYDAHPEAIEENERTFPFRGFASSIRPCHQRIQAFINGELVYAYQAKDHRLMTTPDDNGRLPLHTALQNNVRLGSIKLLVKGNPSALRTVENNLAMPFHIACQHHNSASVVQYLLSLDEAVLDAVDRQWNTVLHYACRGAKYETITLLLEKYDAASVSKTNDHGKLPIDMLWESSAVEDRESVEYTGSIFQLLRAYPEMVAISNSMVNRPVDADTSLNGKKRKRSAFE